MSPCAISEHASPKTGISLGANWINLATVNIRQQASSSLITTSHGGKEVIGWSEEDILEAVRE